MTDQVATVPHELTAFLNYFEDYGTRPYWRLGRCVLDHDGSLDVEIEFRGETWEVNASYSDSGLRPRPSDDVDRETLYEWEINCEGPDRRHAHYNVSPRWTNQQTTSGQLSNPCDQESYPDEGLSIEAQGANLELDEYPHLLRTALRAVGDASDRHVPARWLRPADVDESSRIVAHERYLRYRRSWSEKLVGDDGPFFKIAHLLADQRGTEGELSWDNDQVVGYLTQLKLKPSSVKELLSTHSLGRQLKSYHPEYVRDDESDPLYHPKFGVLVTKQLNDNEAIPWSERREVVRQIDETLLNVLTWADIPIQPDSTTFVADDHFEPQARDDTVTLYDDPTPDLEAEQDHILISTLREGFSDSDWEVLDQMAADGGRPREPLEVADEIGRSSSTIYRCLDRLDDLLEHDHATVRWRSQKIREEIQPILDHFKDSVESYGRQIARVAGVDPQVLEQKGSAFQQWLARWGGELIEGDDPADDLKIKIETMLSRHRSFGSGEFVGKVLKQLRKAWAEAGMNDVASVADLTIVFENLNGEQVTTTMTSTFATRAIDNAAPGVSAFDDDVLPDDPPL